MSRIMKAWGIAPFIALAGLTACGGGGGSDDSPPDTTRQMNGLYEGSLIEDGVGTFDLFAFVFDGDVFAFSPDAMTLYAGGVTGRGQDFTGTLVMYDEMGVAEDSSEINGVFSARETVDGSFDSDGGSTGTFELNYDENYERDSSLARVSGSYRLIVDDYTINVHINASGIISGSDTDGCSFSGEVLVPDPANNIYQVQFISTGCGGATVEFVGYGTLGEDVEQNDTLLVGLLEAETLSVATLIALTRL